MIRLLRACVAFCEGLHRGAYPKKPPQIAITKEIINTLLWSDMSAWPSAPYTVRVAAVNDFLRNEFPSNYPSYHSTVFPMLEWRMTERIEELTKTGQHLPVIGVALGAVVDLGGHIRSPEYSEFIREWLSYMNRNEYPYNMEEGKKGRAKSVLTKGTIVIVLVGLSWNSIGMPIGIFFLGVGFWWCCVVWLLGYENGYEDSEKRKGMI